MKRASLKVGVVQMRSVADPWQNLLHVQGSVEEAIEHGCEFVCFPENVFYRGPKEGPQGQTRAEAHVSLDDDGRISTSSDFGYALAECADSWPVAVSLGSVLEQVPGEALPYNSHWIVRSGGRVESYRKMHLFDFQGTNARYNESRDVRAGGRPRSVSIGGFTVGCSICYDLRFPELFRYLTLEHGTDLLLMPSAFTLETGRAHWHTLLRARAIENLSFVVAAAQWGTHSNAQGQELSCYGHSLVYSPWGDLLDEAPGQGDALLVVNLDREELEKARSRLPSAQTSRFRFSTEGEQS